jgi:branched-chain amino acid transport system permease protein
LQAFAIGAAFAGIAGGLLASWQHSVFPANFLFQESINILAMVILGGVGNLLGVILGATIIVALPEVFRELALYRLLVFGLLLMVLMIFRPQGLLPVARQNAGKAAAPVPPAAADAKEGTAP